MLSSPCPTLVWHHTCSPRRRRLFGEVEMIIQRRSLSSLHSSALNRPHLGKRARKNETDKHNTKKSIAQSVARSDTRHSACIDLGLVQRAIANDAAARDQLC